MAIEFVCKATKINYFNNNFGIVRASVEKVISGKVKLDSFDMITIIGNMPEPILRTKYYVKATEEMNKKFGLQYKIQVINIYLPNGIESPKGRHDFLCTLFTEAQVAEMYKVSDDPYQIFIDEDMAKMVQIKGCGMKTATSWLQKFKNNYAYSVPMAELSEYDISQNLLKKIVDFYGSSQIAIQTIKENPYDLMKISGVGWAKCDAIAMQTGAYEKTALRLEAYIQYYLGTMGECGYSYVPTDIYAEKQLNIASRNNKYINLMDNIIDFFGDSLDNADLNTAFTALKDKLWFNEDRTLIGLKYYRELEEKIANELIRLRDADSKFEIDDIKQSIEKQEEKQGWNYTRQQKDAIYLGVYNQVCLITGLGGTGKSSSVASVLEIFNKYSFAQTSLAGRAAARLTEITNKEGYTIHRLLGYPRGDKEHHMYLYNKDNQLKYDIIILDEVSMVNGELFLHLLEAIPTGSKLIMMGDAGQLESIGSLNIISDLMQSPSIASIELTEIHRQANNSAIVTESIKARHGKMLIDKDWVGSETKGVLQDLTLDCYSDASNTFYRVMQYVSAALDNVKDIMQLCVIVPNKRQQAGTINLNKAIQELYNPASKDKKEIILQKDGLSWVIREGDKVINTQNNYKAVPYHLKDVPIEDDGFYYTSVYNGNIGFVKEINVNKKEITIYFTDLKETVIIKSTHVTSIEPGYAITCHKMQGAECDNVIIGIDFSSYTLLSRQLIYTAITRAKKKCVLVAQNSALRYAVAQNAVSVKETHLQSILYNLDHPTYVF